MSTKLSNETARIETTIRFAQVIDGRNESTEEERRQAFQDAQAEGVNMFDSLRAHMLLGIANGNAALVGVWLREFEFGGFNDNCEAFTVSQHRVENGEVEQGLAVLCLLREHIIQSKEVKSNRHLLPVVNKAITDIKVGLLESTGDVNQQTEDDEFAGFPLYM
jgi:hypothetical protein